MFAIMDTRKHELSCVHFDSYESADDLCRKLNQDAGEERFVAVPFENEEVCK